MKHKITGVKGLDDGYFEFRIEKAENVHGPIANALHSIGLSEGFSRSFDVLLHTMKDEHIFAKEKDEIVHVFVGDKEIILVIKINIPQKKLFNVLSMFFQAPWETDAQ